jgi:hypothetical protein
MADHHLSRPLDRFQLQYINALQMIQKSLQTMELDEGIAIAVFLVLWIDAVRADLGAVRKHLKGFHLILQELQVQSGGAGLSPLILDIWRIAFRLDWTANLYLGMEPVFPSISTTQEDTYLQWLEISVAGRQKSEWAIATFALDNLLNRSCRTAVQARQIRRSEVYSTQHEAIIQYKVAKLEEDIKTWRQSPLIQSAELLEQAAQGQTPTSIEGSFLDYEPLNVFNPFYVNLLNASRSILLYTSLIASPHMGFSIVPERFPLAVDICRTLAALEKDQSLPLSSRIWMHYLAGVAFGGSRHAPREVEWLCEKMEYVGKVFPLTKSTVLAAMRLWEVEGNFWDELEGNREMLGAT